MSLQYALYLETRDVGAEDVVRIFFQKDDKPTELDDPEIDADGGNALVPRGCVRGAVGMAG